MWSRRRFLETFSACPGRRLRRGERRTASAAAARKAGRDYFAELGGPAVHHAAGTYTAMTASLMPPEVMEAINYASSAS